MHVKTLRIGRDGKHATVEIVAALEGTEYKFIFRGGEQQSEAYAMLVADSMGSAFGSLIEDIRRESYNQGWRDAKAKKGAKLTSFFTVAMRCD